MPPLAMKLSLRLPDDLHAAAVAQADRERRSLNAMLVVLIETALSERVKGEGGTRGLATQDGKPVSDSQPPPVSRSASADEVRTDFKGEKKGRR